MPVCIRVFATNGETGFPEDTRDVSHGGFSVETLHPLPVGAQSTFLLTIPHHEVPLQMNGEVVWAKPDGMGVRFTGPVDARVTDFVDRLVKDSERL